MLFLPDTEKYNQIITHPKFKNGTFKSSKKNKPEIIDINKYKSMCDDREKKMRECFLKYFKL